MLSKVQFPFKVIGLSETKFMIDKDILTNVDLPGYDLIFQPDDFNSTLGSLFFQLHILHPTRITNHTANVIDNIFTK